jgi:hypothetical protein
MIRNWSAKLTLHVASLRLSIYNNNNINNSRNNGNETNNRETYSDDMVIMVHFVFSVADYSLGEDGGCIVNWKGLRRKRSEHNSADILATAWRDRMKPSKTE